MKKKQINANNICMMKAIFNLRYKDFWLNFPTFIRDKFLFFAKLHGQIILFQNNYLKYL